MGIGTLNYSPDDASEWNAGSCDIMAVALHRMYGLPLMAEFEWGFEGKARVRGYLMHAWVRLPDGRALDAAGPQDMFVPTQGGDQNDPWVEGYEVVDLEDDDPHLLDSREEDDYVDSIRIMEAPLWISRNLGTVLAELDLEQVGYLDSFESASEDEASAFFP